MNDECFVPNCKNTTGTPFPRDPETKQKWLENLYLTDLIPKPSSFICFAHFDPKDLHDDANNTARRLSNRLRRGAIPCILASKEEKQEDANDTSASEVPESDLDTSQDKTTESNKICRTCMTEENLEASIFDFIENDVTIAEALKQCAYPLCISDNDDLPGDICTACLTSLKAAYEFRKKCLTTDDVLQPQNKENRNKRKAEEPEDAVTKKPCTELTNKDIKNEPSASGATTSDSNDASLTVTLQKKKGRKPNIIKIEKQSTLENDLDYPDILDSSNLQATARRSRRLAHKAETKGKFIKLLESISDIDEIEKNMEEIHGQESKGNLTENDEEEQQQEEAEADGEPTEENAASDSFDKDQSTVEDILNTLEDASMSDEHNVLREFLKKPDVARSIPNQPQKKIIIKRNFPYKKSSNILDNIRLPKDLRIKPVEKYASSLGKFKSFVKTGVYDSIFVQADEYLFELGLVKSRLRHLRCSVPSCPAQAKQRVSEDGVCEVSVEVTVPHNHAPPDEALKKKEMFLCLMRKKMQTDRTLNIRNIYEDACIQDPEIKKVVPLRNVINEICRHQLMHKMRPINSFEDFFKSIELDPFEKLHFTHNNQQFYQEKFFAEEDQSMAVVFGNLEVIQLVCDSKMMYVDASFRIDTTEEFKYQLVTVLVWIDDSYYPIVFALVNKKSQQIFRKIFTYLHDHLAPDLRPQEIITDYEANLYYALAEVYTDSNLGGSVFYYTQNLYKKICSLNLSRDLETNSYFRNIYHMLLMLPLLPVNTILDGLNNIELEARNLNIADVARPIFDHIRTQWILNVTPELFCVHKLENRINENVIAPFKKLRDFLLLTKGKVQKSQNTVMHVIEKLIELEGFLKATYSKPDKKSFGRDLSSFQKKNVLRAWQYIEDHPKIEINNFFSKVLGYIKCMENQLWIWGYYRYDGDADDILINATNFQIISPGEEIVEELSEEEENGELLAYIETPDSTIVMEAMVDQHGVLQADDEIIATENVVTTTQPQQFETAFLKYVYP